jgi:translation initiation factor IF-3
MFRGREQAHPERGEALLRKLADELAELGTIEQQPNQEGRNMTMILAPVRQAAAPRRDQPDQPEGAEPSVDPAAPAGQGNGAVAEPAPENPAPVE